MSILSFGDAIDILQRLREHGPLTSDQVGYVGSLERLMVFELSDLVHSFRPLRLDDDAALALHIQIDRRGRLSQLVNRFDRVLALVFRHNVIDVQRHVAKVVGTVEAGRRRQRFSVAIELDAQVRIVYRRYLALEVGRLSFAHVGRALSVNICTDISLQIRTDSKAKGRCNNSRSIRSD